MLTPPYVLEPVRELLGGIGLDPCTEPDNPTRADKWYSLPFDGCAMPWDAPTVWCNPPYGEARDRWVDRCIAEGAHRKVVLLIPAHTETAMFYEAVWWAADGVLFLKGRPHFHYVDGRRAKFNSGAPIALVAYGSENLDALRHSGLGFVVVGSNA
jgi:hypothetical protein